MNTPSDSYNDQLSQTVNIFWDSIPPFWRRVRNHIRELAVSRFDITVEQFHILRHLRKAPGSVSGLAQIQNISRPAVSQAVDALVNKGLVARTPDTRDRRHICLDLTPEGITLLDSVFGETSRWIKQVLAPLDQGELQTLTDAMTLLKKVLPA